MVDVNDEMWYTYGTKYDSGIENSPSDQGRVRKAVVNRIKNSDFYTGWTQTKGNAADVFSLDDTNLCMSIRGAKMVKGGEGESVFATTAKLFETGVNYTFSAYIKTTGLTVSEGKKGAFIRVTDGENVYESEAIIENTAAREINTFANGWQRVYVTFPFNTEPVITDTNKPAEMFGVNVDVSLVCDASAGTVWFSCPQVEVGEVANMFNLIMNADFAETIENTENTSLTRYYPANWEHLGEDLGTYAQTGVVFDRDVNQMPANVHGNALRLYSQPRRSEIFTGQVIRAYGEVGDVFVLGGWANTNSVQGTYFRAKPSIRYRWSLEAGESNSYFTDWHDAYFTPENGSWHHMTTTIVAPQKYRRMEIAPGYSYNTLTGMFTNFYLYRDLYGSSFTYDDNGNVVNVKDITNLQSQAQYDDYNNLLSYVQPGSAATEKYTFTYGTTEEQKKKHLPLTATTPMGVKSATTYDDFGNATENTIQPSADALFMKTQTTYTDNGNYIASQKDARGNVVTNAINSNGKVTAVTDPAGNTIHYYYDNSNRVTDTFLFSGSKTYKRRFTYENDRKKTISHNTTGSECDVTYTYLYDELGRSIGVKVGNSETPLSTNTFEDNRRGLLMRTDFANGGKVRYAYDAFGRVTAIAFDENDPEVNPQYTVIYDARGTASVVRDNVLGTETRVVSDLADRISESVTIDANGNLLHKTQMAYDGKNRVSAYTDKIPGEMHKTAFTYDADNRLTQIKFDDSENTKVINTYDLLNRLTEKTVTNGVPYTTAYEYLPGDTESYGSNATTSLVLTITQGEGENRMNFAYTYDSRGNITSETRNGITVEYIYDEIGQLVRVNDLNDETYSSFGTTWLYIYDCGGNLQMRLACRYSPGTEFASGLLNGNYTYGDENWKDKLTVHNDNSITYDAMGNPTEYGTWTYSWKMGRLLDIASNSEGNFALEFKYNKNGLRTQKIKKVDGTVTETTDYVMSNKTLISMKKGNDTLYFSYDMSGGSPVMVTYNGAIYTYVKNLLGDIVALVDASGNIVCEYKYDAWGKPLSVTGTMAQTIGALNPFRYRGYIWDEDMESYYLRSRYYNPSICRFLQADSHLTFNAFAYANNNPVMKIDADGTEATSAETVDVVIYYHVEQNSDGSFKNSHYSMSIGDFWISFDDTNKDIDTDGKITVCALDDSTYITNPLPTTQTIYRDVPFENVRNGFERILLACTYSGDSYKAIETCTNMNEIKDCITTLGYYGVNTDLNPNYTYIYFWRPCISLIYEVCQDIMLIDIDNTIGTFYRTDLDPKGGSIFLRAYEAMKCRNVPFGKIREFERSQYVLRFTSIP